MDLAIATALLGSAWMASEDERRSALAPGVVLASYRVTDESRVGGGTGQVYRATHVHNGGDFALKRARPGVPESIFLEERHKARLLNHPNILVAHDGGTWDGRPFLVFRWLEGGHLTERARRERYSEPDAILGLMQKLASAVTFAHRRAVLHCDLKPSNVVFDAQHEPHIVDFGLARTIEASGSSAQAWGGTRGWMSPEQVEKGSLGVESDVFTLGVILFWLLQDGELPFGCGDDYEARLRANDIAPLRARHRWDAVGWDLTAICARALRQRPGERYASAAELETDLERVAAGRVPRAAGARGWFLHPTRWVRRHPWLALGGLIALGLPAYAFWIQQDALGEVRSALRPHNRFTAKAQARAVVSELFGMALRVHAMARDPDVMSLIHHPDIGHEASALEAHAAGFDSVNVFVADGRHSARWPTASPRSARNVLHADHFRCALALADERLTLLPGEQAASLPVCVAKAHRSGLDGRIKLGLSAPLFDSDRLVGVVEASTMARERFGALQMSCGPGDCFTALLGPRDRDGPDLPLPGALSVLAQQGIELGREVRLPAELSRKVCSRLDCEPDPLRPFDPERSEPFELDPYEDPVTSSRTLAVIAPVARTGLSVLIATPHSATHAQLASLAAVALRGAWMPVLFGIAAWLLFRFAPNPRWPWPASRAASRQAARLP
jgi:hypothetical protein